LSQNLSITEVRKLILNSQVLSGPTLSPLQIIEHLGYVQIDTISVIERAHHHTFWTRNSKYKPNDLDQLVKSRKVFEYWSHAASYLPMKDYRYTLPMKLEFRKKKSSWFPKNPKLMKSILKRIESEGPLRSKDFKNTTNNKSGWWDWKPAKQSLERLFMEGLLEISYREGFQKVYDLPERVIPNTVDTSMPDKKEYIRFLIHRCLRHHGLATSHEIAYLQKSALRNEVEKELKEMLFDKEVVELKIPSIEESYYALAKVLNKSPRSATSKTLILSPFDNFIIQRKKLSKLFNFDYQIECYVPEKKRKYGYFSLPIFNGCQPIARMDCKANRKEKILEVHSAHFEKSFKKSRHKSKIESKLKQFAKFNGCHTIQFLNE
jgi:hypothetical protein